jgi:hypothetical protein
MRELSLKCPGVSAGCNYFFHSSQIVVHIPADNSYMCTLFRKSYRNSLTDTFGATRNHKNFAGKIQIHISD